MIYKKIRNIFSLIFSLALMAAILSGNLPHALALGNHLDTTFGSNGKLIVNFTGTDSASDIAIQTDGKIIVAGTNDASGTDNTDFAVVRLNPNGSLDNTFNSTGMVVTSVLGDGNVNAVSIQPDGKIVVAGNAVMNGITQFCLVRYNTNGSLDTTFDGNGIVYTIMNLSDPGNISGAIDVTVQPDGKIVAVGLSRNSGDTYHDWAIARYNANGSLDTTFDGDGRIIVDFGSLWAGERAYSVVIQPNGKILVGGSGTTNHNFVLARYNANGSPDTTFAGSGTVITDLGGSDVLKDIKVLPDGRIIAAGGDGNFGTDLEMARYHSNGSLDTSFDGDGKLLLSIFSWVQKIVIQSDGKIVGLLETATLHSFQLVRINPNGSIDAGFGKAGKLTTPITTFSDVGKSIAIQSDGKLVAVGTAYNTGNNENYFGIARYLPEMGKPFDFDNDGKTDIGIFRSSNGEWWINRSSNGTGYALQFGSNTDRIAPADYTGDGKTDIAFFRPSNGSWFVLRSEDNSFYSFPFGTNGDIPAPADFDGDGKTDAAVFRPSNATWYISRSTGGSTAQQFGQNGDVPVTADYDSDGKADIAIFRPSSGQWWIQKSSNNSVIAFQFGNSSDKPVPGDYTGDGKADVAIFRPASGEWFVLRSDNQSFYSFPFGANGDIPAPGDYDGDGRFDATIFRPSAATWYSQRTSAGTLIQSFGQNGDRPVPNAFVP